MKTAIVFLLLVLTTQQLDIGAASDVGTADADCVATALAEADPSNAVGEAISNAIAQAFSRVVACDGKENESAVGASSLAISVAVAIASSETAGAECVAEGDAVAEVVSELVTQGVAGGLLENTDPVQQTLAEAWLAEEASAIATRLQEGEDSLGDGSGSCTVAGLRKSLTTARDVGAAMEDAISQILLAVSCGDNLQTVDPEAVVPAIPGGILPGISSGISPGISSGIVPGIGGGFTGGFGSTTSTLGGPTGSLGGTQQVKATSSCRYDSKQRKFFGTCFAATTKRRNCNQEFRDCESAGRSSKTCREELTTCSDATLTEVVKDANP
ncbi:hypothetical protein BSKO_10665 [Bryopsis sp. KO-2023]|nr:hypothetical protein BSKO_10665 [Bryopsis sp. KO-2023]